MESQRYEPAEAYPTRRSIREAERRAERARQRTKPVTPPVPVVDVDATAEIPKASQAPVAVPAIPQPLRPVTSAQSIAPTRRSLRLAETPKRKTAAIPRVAILGSLAAATTIIPLNGIPASIANTPEHIDYPASDVLDVLMDASSDGESAFEVSALAADPRVGVRAALTASRSNTRGTPLCSVNAGRSNGVAAAETAFTAPKVVMPIAAGAYRISSHYGHRTLFGRYSMHAGLDFAAPNGTPIHSVADGVVEYTGPGKAGRSNMLMIVRHNINGQIVRSWYVHMYSNGIYVRPGQYVKAGQVIGAVGNNGFSTGPHLHFEIHLDDRYTTTNPATWLANNGAAPLTRELRQCLSQ